MFSYYGISFDASNCGLLQELHFDHPGAQCNLLPTWVTDLNLYLPSLCGCHRGESDESKALQEKYTGQNKYLRFVSSWVQNEKGNFFFFSLTVGSFVSLLQLAFSFTCKVSEQKTRKLHLRDMNSRSTSLNKGEFAGNTYCFKTSLGKQNQMHLCYKKGTSENEFRDLQVSRDVWAMWQKRLGYPCTT